MCIILTSIGDQQRYQVRLVLGQNCGKFLEISDTSASQEFQKFVVAVTRVNRFHKMLSLRPRDNSDCRTSKLTDKGSARVYEIQQMNTIHSQRPNVRTNVTELSSDICSNNNMKILSDMYTGFSLPSIS